MIINDKIRDEKLQHDINREGAKILALSSGKIDKYEYLTGEEILSSDQRRVIEQAKFTYSPLGKALEKQRKTIGDQRIKQVQALKALKSEANKELESIEGIFPKNMKTNEIKNEINEIRKWEEKNKQKDSKYKANKYLYDFQEFETIRSFGDSIYTGKINTDEAEMDQSNLLENVVKFNNKYKPKTKEGNAKKHNTFYSVNALYEGRELTLNTFRSGIFSIKATQGKRLKILTPKQLLQRLLITLAQVKADNTSENLPNEIRQIIYSLYRAKEITKKGYNNIMNSIKL